MSVESPEAKPYTPTFRDIPQGALLQATELCVGFNVIEPHTLIGMGIPEDLVNPLVREHHVKRFSLNPSVRLSQTGVRGFELLDKISDDLGIDKTSYFKDDGNLALEYKEKITAEINYKNKKAAHLIEGIEIDL